MVGAGAVVATAETVIVTPAAGDSMETGRRSGRSRAMLSSTRCHPELLQPIQGWPDSNSKDILPMANPKLLLATISLFPHQVTPLSILHRLKDITSIKDILHQINMAEISQVQ